MRHVQQQRDMIASEFDSAPLKTSVDEESDYPNTSDFRARSMVGSPEIPGILTMLVGLCRLRV